MLRLAFVLIANLWLILFWPLRAWRRLRAAPKGAWVEIEIDGGLTEVPRRVPFWAQRSRSLALESLRRVVRLAAGDARVAGLLFTIKHLRAGSASATSLREVLLAARQTGKRVAVYLPNGGGTRETFVASAAERVILGPETHLSPLGYAIEAHYFRELLDKAGIEPDVFARGRYKTAGEPLMARSMSEAQREQLDALLDVAWDTLLDALASGRGVDRETAERWVHAGPWPARAALESKLADAIAYPSEVAKLLDPGRKEGAPIVRAGRYVRRRKLSFVRLGSDRLGVIEVLGPIVPGETPSLVPLALESAVVEAAKRAGEDPSVRGVVVHVDSRGGSALASDRMLFAIRQLAEKKPVVAYMGDAAASGGYMVAVGAQAIIAQPTTVTGSIGVVAARFVLEPLLARAGIGTELLKRGARADLMTSARRLTPDEREVIERQIDDVYRSFVSAVARGRNLSEAEVEPLAGGRVWSGRDAARHGLVDRLGGFDVALEELRSRLGPGAERLEAVIVAPPRIRPPPALLSRLVQSFVPQTPGELVALGLACRRDPAWAWCPLSLADLG
jgi:protease IV